MKIEKFVCLSMLFCVLSAFAQVDARTAYQQRQAVQEVQRLSSQFDQLQNGMEILGTNPGKSEDLSELLRDL